MGAVVELKKQFINADEWSDNPSESIMSNEAWTIGSPKTHSGVVN